jgi:tetratricopeptide (TPR) repeat protein
VALAVLPALGPVSGNGFLGLDDDVYLTANPWVRRGLGWEGVRWAFTSVGYAANWHPLTWLSHMLDASLFGGDPAGHHSAGLLLHAANAALMVAVLRAMIGALWPAALVGALFALHPLHVESVAWASERKDLLSTFFVLLTVALYLRHLRRPGPGRYLAVAGSLTLALLAKPMAVTLPLVLLLLDYWPLGRILPAGDAESPLARVAVADAASGPGASGTGGAIRAGLGLVAEKAPLLALAALASWLTLLAQGRGGVVVSLDYVSLPQRLGNALVSLWDYLGQAFLPMGLSVFYPHPRHHLPWWKPVLALLGLLGVTGGLWRLRRSRPCLAVGWLLFLVMLLPVLGLVQVGLQARADRYTYLPMTGIFLMLAVGPAALARRRRLAFAVLSLAVLASLGALSHRQSRVWRDDASLFGHALSVTTSNWWAHYNLGNTLLLRGDSGEAERHLLESVRHNPDYLKAHFLLGSLYAVQERYPESALHFGESVRIEPRDAESWNGYGGVLFTLGRVEEALVALDRAIRLDPSYARARYNLGMVLTYLGRPLEAGPHLAEAHRLDASLPPPPPVEKAESTPGPPSPRP